MKKFVERNKKILLLIGIAILIIFYCYKCYSFNHSFQATKDFILYNIIMSCFISMIAAFIIMIFFDDKNKKNLEKRRQLLFYNLVYSINNINNVIAQMYKATSEKIKENDPILKNVYYDKEKLLQQINKLDFYKKAPIYGDILWYEYLINSSLVFINEITNIREVFLMDIDDKLLEKIYQISPSVSMRDKYNFEIMKLLYKNKYVPAEAGQEHFLMILPEFINDIYELMKYIDETTKKNNFALNKNICGEGIAPEAMSGLKQ